MLLYWLWSAWDLLPTAPELFSWCDACFDYVRTVWFAGAKRCVHSLLCEQSIVIALMQLLPAFPLISSNVSSLPVDVLVVLQTFLCPWSDALLQDNALVVALSQLLPSIPLICPAVGSLPVATLVVLQTLLWFWREVLMDLWCLKTVFAWLSPHRLAAALLLWRQCSMPVASFPETIISASTLWWKYCALRSAVTQFVLACAFYLRRGPSGTSARFSSFSYTCPKALATPRRLFSLFPPLYSNRPFRHLYSSLHSKMSSPNKRPAAAIEPGDDVNKAKMICTGFGHGDSGRNPFLYCLIKCPGRTTNL